MKSNGCPQIPYICFQFQLPTETVFRIFVSLEMIGHLGAAESLKRAVGRADSLTNVSVNSNSNRVSYHFPVKQVFQPCWMIHSFSTIAIICHVSMPFHIHCSFYMNVPYQPAPNPLLLTIPSQPKHHHTDDTFSSHVLKMTSYILYILQLQLLTYCIKLYTICFL